MESLPSHLKKYVVEQNYEKYTPIDQAVWRFILRQLKAYLSVHAHECYVEGLEKTGIEIERIPKISDISAKLAQFGWRALPVSGFIPPAAFMELQSLSVLPIASELRSLDHLLYTPAPDIVHEAAGHAPILVHPEFAEYLRRYSQVAKKAIISREDLDLYEAIRKLSDIKENPESTQEEIQAAEKELEEVSKKVSFVSEAAELSRMNWWTAEYGLIGDINNPKIFGAGLLSSVGESRWCLSSKVKKIPLTVDCIKYSYDITEPQPQLFVTPNFEHLTTVLEDFAKTMAFKQGGLAGVKKAIQAESVNTAELESGIQISGQFVEALTDNNNQIIYLKLQGPCQLAYKDNEIPGHEKNYHSQGFGTPVGFLKKFLTTSPAKLSESQWKELGVSFEGNEGLQTAKSQPITLEFVSGVKVQGECKSRYFKDGKTLILTLTKARAEYNGQVLFDPAWGNYDIALGTHVVSVYGGAADREAYGEARDFVVARVPAPKLTDKDKRRHQLYQKVRDLREKKTQGSDLETALKDVFQSHLKDSPDDWLLFLEIYELGLQRLPNSKIKSQSESELKRICEKYPEKREIISDGLSLAAQG